jgi:hypothetical protein
MPASPSETLAAATMLRHRLEGLADALAGADLQRLLDTEPHIDAALTALAQTSGTAAQLPALTVQLEGIRHALLRCRRLGVSLTSFVQLTMSAHGRDAVYGQSAIVARADVHTFRQSV